MWKSEHQLKSLISGLRATTHKVKFTAFTTFMLNVVKHTIRIPNDENIHNGFPLEHYPAAFLL